MPIGNLPGWTQVFTDDFPTNVPEGGFSGCQATSNILTSSCSGLPASVRSKWWAYPDGWPDTTGNGTYMPSQVISIQNGIMDLRMRNEGGVNKVAAPVPIIPTATGPGGGMLYGRYEIRWRTDTTPGFKLAWLLWPDSENWPQDGEIDFPEGSLNGTISAFMHRQNGVNGGDQDAYGTSVPLGGAWHTTIVEWTPSSLKFYLDGQLIGNSTSRIPDTPMHLVLQSETDMNGTLPATGAVANVQIDWIAVWEPAA